MRYHISAVCAAGLVMSAAASLNAQTISLEANWSNQSTGATAVATFDLDLPTFNAVSNGFFGGNSIHSFASLGVSNFSLTIAGASSGNGTWTDADLSGMVMYTNVLIDPTIEWVGQPQGDSSIWGVYDGSGLHDFNVFSSVSGSPNGTWYYELTASGGETLYLTSVHPVPAPAATAVLGLGGLATLRRRRR
ncbi:MAG: PEP-CTERM sorting domain-containing protein [Phycisphaerales bacterium]